MLAAKHASCLLPLSAPAQHAVLSAIVGQARKDEAPCKRIHVMLLLPVAQTEM